MSQQANATAPRKHPQVPRTFAMTVVGAGCWVMVAGLAYFLVYLIGVYGPASGDERIVRNLPPIFTTVAAIFGVLGTLSLAWAGARRRAWFWLIPVILAVLIVAFNAPVLPYDLARPANTAAFLITVAFLTGAIAIIGGGIVAFFEVRRGRPIWTRSGRAGALSLVGIGIAVGAAATALLVGLVPTGGPGGTKTPTVTGVITIEDLAFVGSPQMKDGEVLGLIITNPEDVPHSFDIDSLDIHVQVTPKTTTAVVIQPTGPGNLEFYCSVQTHRERGMVGAITVD
ncbi:MAG: cupredoxin domain-containing protein [Chloroflexi bacterium]|nr:cupredoxin domain-containing protein [Chloroflexota bacterium]